jgi:sigma-B regulation protein RsbU (phosphoserine phosphatase)
MKPSDEVGGDYYDVVQANQSEWILVGDVSGHGVPAGLVMMMCQTAVRTILRRDPDVLPDRLLAMVNGVLTENIRRLGDDKYMTITALRFEPDGTVLYAGAHQDLFIYRAASASVEALPTSGLWLGLRDEIGGRLRNDGFALRKDDVLVLFTDGITEARRDGALFDTHGIRRALGRAGGKTARGVLDAIFEDLSGYAVDDDATAVVVRQGETHAEGRA